MKLLVNTRSGTAADMRAEIGSSRVGPRLMLAAQIVWALLMAKVLVMILWEYRLYFPANFDESAFLTGRRETFTALYASAFYTHIIVGPPVLLLAAWSMWSGAKAWCPKLHRWAGRVQAVLIFGALVPTGLVMATRAFSGPLAGAGFVALSLATAGTLGMAIYYAVQRKFVLHRRWATRCFVLLISPLILRIVSGALIVTESWTEMTYQLNAWLSWIIPLMIFETWWRYKSGRFSTAQQPRRVRITPEAVL